MLILPVFRQIDWRRPPLVTLAIIFINVFVYAVIQDGDDSRMLKAEEYYLRSDLPRIEYPLYGSYLQQTYQLGKYEALFDGGRRDESDPDPTIHYEIESDTGFKELLKEGSLIGKESGDYAIWHGQRDIYDSYVAGVITQHYGFSPTQPNVVSLFSHMFLHGSLMHLVGNMAVLFVVGFAVEMILGWRVYTVSYVLGGLAAVGLYWFIHIDEPGPLVGASGAIAGVMGMYATLFGLRKISFFYFVFFYMGFFVAPAILVLVVWLLNELVQFLMDPESHVAYMAHFGGLIGGAVIGFVNRHFNKQLDFDYMEAPAKEEKQAADFARGVELMRELKFDQARPLFRVLLEKDPTNVEVLSHMYTVSKGRPDSDDYHNTALAILKLSSNENAAHTLANQVFNEYVKIAKPVPRLSVAMCLTLGSRLGKAGFMDTSEKIIRVLMPKASTIPALASLILQVGYSYARQNNQEKAGQYYKLLLKYFPDSKEAGMIRTKNKT